MITYETFCSPSAVATFKAVKTFQQDLARIARGVACEMVDGYLPVSGKQFIETGTGKYRLSMNERSDNSTEVGVHEGMGAVAVNMGDEEQMKAWFAKHHLFPDSAWAEFLERVTRRAPQ